MVVVPNRLLVVLRVVLPLLLGIPLLQGILLLQGIPLLQGILLPREISSLVDRLVGVEWVAIPVDVPVLRLAGRVCLALVLVGELLRPQLFAFCVQFVGGFLLLLRV